VNATDGSTPAGLVVGRVGRPHGLDGSFYITRPKPRLLSLGAVLTVAESQLEVVRLAGTDKHPIVRLDGVSDREAAEALRGLELTVDTREAPVLADGEWWSHELEGCEVLDGARTIGTVLRMIELPSCEALEVRPLDGGASLLVPMVKDAVRRVEPAARRIEVNLDFLDLATPPSDPGEARDTGERS
jgi:16S rRNA processing protein RimM